MTGWFSRLGFSSSCKRFEDGSALKTDPRREDPYYYYETEEGPAIGFQVLPLWGEDKAESVEIHLVPEYLARFQEIGTNRARLVYPRLLTWLVAGHPKWRHVRLALSLDKRGIENEDLSRALEECGFDAQSSNDPRRLEWSRHEKS